MKKMQHDAKPLRNKLLMLSSAWLALGFLTAGVAPLVSCSSSSSRDGDACTVATDCASGQVCTNGACQDGGGGAAADLGEVLFNVTYGPVTRVGNNDLKIPLCIDPSGDAPPDSITVDNLGKGDSGPFKVGLGFVDTADKYQSCSDLFSDGLKVGFTSTWEKNYCCNAAQGPVGAYKIRVVADINKEVAEANETNNTGESQLFMVMAPGPMSCQELVACHVGCGDCGADCGSTCATDCDDNSSADAKTALEALLACSADCADSACIEEKCAMELAGCAAATAPGTTQQVLRLVAGARAAE